MHLTLCMYRKQYKGELYYETNIFLNIASLVSHDNLTREKNKNKKLKDEFFFEDYFDIDT